jgi:hypothetical protein
LGLERGFPITGNRDLHLARRIRKHRTTLTRPQRQL